MVYKMLLSNHITLFLYIYINFIYIKKIDHTFVLLVLFTKPEVGVKAKTAIINAK